MLNGAAVARRSKNDTGNPRADQTTCEHLFGRRHGGLRLPSQVASLPAGPRVPTVDPDPSRIHDGYTTTPAVDDRIDPTATADAVYGGRQ
jgi:hypothetical protein